MKGIPPMATTVVGSFPSSPPMNSLLKYCREGSDPFGESMRDAIDAQISAGIDIISDGQTRNDMVRLFASKLGGIRMRSKPEIIGPISLWHPITAEDQKLARKLIEGRAMLKGIITGPFTLAMSCKDSYYASKEKAAMAFADALNGEARALSETVDVVQVDEPYFSVECPEYSEQLVSSVFSGVNVPKSLHVCGDVAGIFPKLAEMPVDILDHEFAAHPELLETMSETAFSQMLGYGCVRSDLNTAETVEVISERIKKGIACVGEKRLVLDPDCGLRHLSAEVARAKLENLVKARNAVMEDES